jgi:hypothetical protein
MTTASAGRAARGCRMAPARSARPGSAPASRFPGRAGAKPITRAKQPLPRSKARKPHEQPLRNRRTEDRSRSNRSIPGCAAPPLFPCDSAEAREQRNTNRFDPLHRDRPIPGPSREPEPPPSETPFQHQTPAREALQAVSTRTCVPIADILGRNRRRRSPPLVTRRFGASAWRRAGRCRAWDGSSNATTRPSCTRSARWRSARPAIPNCSPT